MQVPKMRSLQCGAGCAGAEDAELAVLLQCGAPPMRPAGTSTASSWRRSYNAELAVLLQCAQLAPPMRPLAQLGRELAPKQGGREQGGRELAPSWEGVRESGE